MLVRHIHTSDSSRHVHLLYISVVFHLLFSSVNIFHIRPLSGILHIHPVHFKGIFALLDDECKLPKGHDEAFARKLYKDYSKNPRFVTTKSMVVNFEFVVRHYAGEVCYDVHTFVDKNRDQVPADALRYVMTSELPFVSKHLFKEDAAAAAAAQKVRETVMLFYFNF